MTSHAWRGRRSPRECPPRYSYIPGIPTASPNASFRLIYLPSHSGFWWQPYGSIADVSLQPGQASLDAAGRTRRPGHLEAHSRNRETDLPLNTPENPLPRSYFDSRIYREAGITYETTEETRPRRPPPPYTHYNQTVFDPYGDHGAGINSSPQATTPQGAPNLPESEYCPLCLVPFSTLSASAPEQREAHVTSCIATASSSTPPTPAHLVNSTSAMDGRHPRHSGANRNRVYYILGEKELDTIERDKKNECPICMEGYEVGHEMGRLECLCRFHRECIDKWFGAQGMRKRCPIHFHW
jgi:hypothetical protein